ncbi:MAG: TonB-dependent receptor, partial [Bacteroidaceae bacterium]|nr:TonB-dependent receptor [Bacteroidaceae bacterium]
VLTYSNLFQSGIYSYDLYNKIDGSKPGTTRENSKVEIVYDDQWDNLFLQVKVSAGVEKASNYHACGDSLSEGNKNIFDLMLNGYGFVDEAESRLYPYEFQYWNNYTFSGGAQLGYNYTWSQQKGTVLLGFQYGRFIMNDTYYMIGENDKLPCYPTEDQRALLLGKESTVSGYLQIKHNILPNLIFNGGLRFDRKYQFNGRTHNAWSPRVSLIWNPSKNINLKTCYAHSFVDAPFFYRANTTIVYPGGIGLNPETMDAIQFNFIWKSPRMGLNGETNLFFNRFGNLITLLNQGLVNAGSFQITGLEQTFRLQRGRHTASLNMTLQNVIKSKDYNAHDYYVFCVPNIMAKLLYNVNAFQSKPYGTLDVHANLSYTGKTRIYNRMEGIDNIHTIKDHIITNIGLEYNWKIFTLACNLYNAFNSRYHRGGSFSRPIPQLGRNFMIDLKIKL